MSAFLGPIHYMLFSKIQFQDNLCLFLMEKAEKKEKGFWDDIKENTYFIPQADLAEIIDLGNIHGSLQNMIEKVEFKLAFIIKKIRENNIFTHEEVLELAKEYGQATGAEQKITLTEAYQLLTATLLNGMPCDRVQEIIEHDETTILWRDRIDIHARFWEETEQDSRIFYQIRSAVIVGLLSTTEIRYEELRPFEYRLRRIQ